MNKIYKILANICIVIVGVCGLVTLFALITGAKTRRYIPSTYESDW